MANGNGDSVRAWFPLIAMMLGLAVTWGSLQTQVNANEEAVKKLEEKDDSDDVKHTQDKVKIEVLATKQSAILEDVQEIKEVQKDQSKKLDAIIDKLNQLD